jgi:ubiquinone/menaquinone biosynthesis C-methylase UbiE
MNKQCVGVNMEYNKINYNEYADKYSIYRNASERVVNHIIDNLTDEEISTMLEIGCGTADHLYELKNYFRNYAYGFDRSIEMLKQAGLKNPGLNLLNSDIMSKFPYESDFFDFAFSINVIHYIADLRHYYNEAHRVLKKNGLVLTISASTEEMKKYLLKYFSEFGQNSEKSESMFEMIKQSMKLAGFKDINVTYTNYTYKMTENHIMPLKNKAYAWTRLLSEQCLQNGLRKMKKDIEKDRCEGNEYYVYIWGRK